MSHEALTQNYPVLYQSLYQVIHTTGERVNRIYDSRKEK